MSVLENYNSSITPTHYGVAEFVHMLFKDEYKCNSVKKSYVWFHKQDDGSWKQINEILIRNRLSTDVVDGICIVRNNIKNNKTTPEFTRMEVIASASKSLEALQLVLRGLIEKKYTLRDLNKIDETREVDVQIREAESSIDMITKKMDLQRFDIKDRMFSELADVEMKLYNSTFKNGVMKELIGFFYVDE